MTAEKAMINKRVLKDEPENSVRNTEKALQFLIEKFDAQYFEHPFLDSLITLNNETWLVVSSVSEDGVDIYNGDAYDQHDFIREINDLDAGILIIQQLADYKLCIYLIDEVILLKKLCKTGFHLEWDSVEKIKRFSEKGFVLDAELIGFRVFRRARFEAQHSLSATKLKKTFE